MSENYNLDFIKIYKQIRSKTKEEKPRLLLHVCCGACSCYPLIFLADLFDITVLFTNSNIDEYEEFITRFNAARKHASLVEKTCKTRIKFVKDEYNYDTFREDLKQFPIKILYFEHIKNIVIMHILIIYFFNEFLYLFV